jgi:hypothetical protein
MAEYEVITAPCSLLKGNQCFGGTCHLHLHVQRISQSEAGSNEKLMVGYSSFKGGRVSKEFCMLLVLQ